MINRRRRHLKENLCIRPQNTRRCFNGQINDGHYNENIDEQSQAAIDFVSKYFESMEGEKKIRRLRESSRNLRRRIRESVDLETLNVKVLGYLIDEGLDDQLRDILVDYDIMSANRQDDLDDDEILDYFEYNCEKIAKKLAKKGISLRDEYGDDILDEDGEYLEDFDESLKKKEILAKSKLRESIEQDIYSRYEELLVDGMTDREARYRLVEEFGQSKEGDNYASLIDLIEQDRW